MKKITILLLFLATVAYQVSAQAPPRLVPGTGNIIYVNTNVDQSNPRYTGDGSSWSQAVPELADALEWARVQSAAWNAQRPLNIYVAAGTYHPLYRLAEQDDNQDPTTGRDRTFLMVPNVQLYGGFHGGETSLDQRDWRMNETILSGAIYPVPVYHVVVSQGDVGVARLDGFTVSGGGTLNPLFGADGAVEGIFRQYGGGIYTERGSPTFSNLSIQDNVAWSKGIPPPPSAQEVASPSSPYPIRAHIIRIG